MTETDWDTYQWYYNGIPITTSGTGDVYVASLAGTYKVLAQSGTLCGASTKIITAKNLLTAPAAPIIVASSTVVCQGTTSLSVKNTTGITAFQWGINGGILVDDTTSSINAYYSGTYFVTVQASNGCTNDTVSQPITLSTNVETPVITATTTELQANNVLSPGSVSYQWFAEGRAIINYTSPTMPLYYNGTYNVEVTYPNDCRMFSADYVVKGFSRKILRVAVNVTDSTLVLPNVEVPNFAVYPNPNNGSFAIDYSSDYTNSSIDVKLYNSTGVLINSWNFENTSGKLYEPITTQGLLAGIYMLTLSDGSNSYTTKLVIE